MSRTADAPHRQPIVGKRPTHRQPIAAVPSAAMHVGLADIRPSGICAHSPDVTSPSDVRTTTSPAEGTMSLRVWSVYCWACVYSVCDVFIQQRHLLQRPARSHPIVLLIEQDIAALQSRGTCSCIIGNRVELWPFFRTGIVRLYDRCARIWVISL